MKIKSRVRAGMIDRCGGRCGGSTDVYADRCGGSGRCGGSVYY